MPRILLPSDGSASSIHAVRHVVDEFNKRHDLEIHVINVQRPFSAYLGRFISHQDKAEFYQEQASAALLPVRQALDLAGTPYAVHTETGDKAACIAAAALRLGCNRIVMGTSRRSALLRWVECSVTNQVIERASVPVELIPGDAVPMLERVAVPAGLIAGLALLLAAVE